MNETVSDQKPLLVRLGVYLHERFPLAANGLLTALMCAGSMAPFIDGSVGSLLRILAAFATVLPFFFLMRVADEHKDFEDDLAYRPERPVPRGLISLAELRRVAALVLLIPLAICVFLSPLSLVPLAAAIIWISAMSVEFGVKEWLRDRPVVYLISHMLVMPLLGLLAVSFAFVRLEGLPLAQLAGVAVLALFAGLVLEVGRKLWSPDEEREGVETYSKLWGARRGATILVICAAAALFAAAVLPGIDRMPLLTAVFGSALVAVAAFRYARDANLLTARLLRGTAVIVVIAAYSLSIAGAIF